MNVKFITLGCKVNQVETEAMQRLFELGGHSVVDAIEDADAVVINTCAVTAVAAQKSRQMIHKAARSGALIAVVGCYAQESPSEIDADILIGTKDRSRIVELVEKNFFDRQSIENKTVEKINIVGEVGTAFEEMPHVPSRTRAFIKIEDGCDQRCSYCIIPTLRGSVRSRSLESIRAECRQLHDLGFKEIVLTGIHLGAYGKDCGLKLIDAVDAALECGQPERLRLSSIETTEIHDEFIDRIKNDRRMCRHLHLPLQSGCDEILRAMRRPYSTKRFARLLERLAVEVPNISLTTDLIVGFPGETKELFEETVAFVEAMPFSKLHVFPYSIRKGTVAAKMPDQVSAEVKRERTNRMIEISNRKSIEYRKKFLGSTVEMLTETRNGSIVDGLTDNYIRVFVEGELELGKIIKVELVSIENDGVRGQKISGERL